MDSLLNYSETELIANMEQGKLTEISPFGTGFIEFADGRVLGFHHSMLATAVPRDLWPLLKDKAVVFELQNGVARQVRFASGPLVQAAICGVR